VCIRGMPGIIKKTKKKDKTKKNKTKQEDRR
jgi:hypothetical protein